MNSDDELDDVVISVDDDDDAPFATPLDFSSSSSSQSSSSLLSPSPDNSCNTLGFLMMYGKMRKPATDILPGVPSSSFMDQVPDERCSLRT